MNLRYIEQGWTEGKCMGCGSVILVKEGDRVHVGIYKGQLQGVVHANENCVGPIRCDVECVRFRSAWVSK